MCSAGQYYDCPNCNCAHLRAGLECSMRALFGAWPENHSTGPDILPLISFWLRSSFLPTDRRQKCVSTIASSIDMHPAQHVYASAVGAGSNVLQLVGFCPACRGRGLSGFSLQVPCKLTGSVLVLSGLVDARMSCTLGGHTSTSSRNPESKK